MADFTPAEQGAILYHLGLPSSGKTAYSLGGVKASESFSTVISSLQYVDDFGKVRALDIVAAMEAIEKHKRELSSSAEFLAVGDIARRADALAELNLQYTDWREKLATHLLGPHGLKLLGANSSHPMNGTWSR